MRPLVDPFGRAITYLRVSVTDRCDLRCIYCMSERMRFLPRTELLTVEELDRLCTTFVARGVRRLRFTGGEPLVRRGFLDLLGAVGRHLGHGLDEITVTTNGVQLAAFAEPLAQAGVKRDSLKVGDKVVISGRPSRVAGEYRVLMVNLSRPADGFTWGRGANEVVD